ncbi:uncharacterized protein LOC134624716 isoform X1 [Pelmatolapia mariae]|uniref:uncharacterized protein LOC134624716 isoform X1 n=1 Tax=Pelmatolapia mariae TaxID=158779 RepID=UPI002FE54A82
MCNIFRAGFVPWIILSVTLASGSDDKINIRAESGQNITLPCRAHNNQKPIIVVEWIRSDLGAGYALLFQDEHFVPDHQHPSFKNRVNLQDKQMKDGDVSLILNNVTPADSGTYECHVVTRGANQRERATEHTCTIELKILPLVQINTTAGQTVILPCQVSNLDTNPSVVIEWSRTDLGTEHVFFYQDQKFIPDDQHPSFKNRVDLQDRQMKDGDVSLILKNVTINDTGTYMCCVFMKGAKHRRRAKLDSDLISVVNLSVVPPGQQGDTEDGVIRYKVIYFLLFLVPVPVAVILICKKKNKNNPPLPTPLTDEVANEVY